jgi:putative transposase
LRFKGKGWFKTFTYPQSGFKIVETGKRTDILHLSKIGNVPIRIHRKVEGKVKTLTVKRYASGKWFTCISVERDDEAERKPLRKAVGLDVGLRYFLTDSDGRQVENPKFYKRSLQRIRVEHQRLSRKKKGSRNRERQRVRLARIYEKLVNQRNDFLHKLSRFYVNNYDLTVVEDLNIKGMVRNHNLAGKILDASWGKLLQMLHYKAENAGGVVVKVNPRGTSKEHKHGELDRDYNASLNILERGLSGMGQPYTPVEMEPLRELIQFSASSIVEAGSPHHL